MKNLKEKYDKLMGQGMKEYNWAMLSLYPLKKGVSLIGIGYDAPSNKLAMYSPKGKKPFPDKAMNRITKAIEYFKKAIKIDSSRGGAYKWLGRCYDHLRNFDEAIKYYKIAIKKACSYKEELKERIKECGLKKKEFDKIKVAEIIDVNEIIEEELECSDIALEDLEIGKSELGDLSYEEDEGFTKDEINKYKSENEITDFYDFSIELEDIEDLDEEGYENAKYANLKDKKGNFHGQYKQSQNKKYIIIYDNGISLVDKKGKDVITHGQIYLIENKNKILWKKKTRNTIHDMVVTNNGLVIVFDWERKTINLHFINKESKEVFQYIFDEPDCDIGGELGGEKDFSEKYNKFIVKVSGIYQKIYCFDTKNNKLLWIKELKINDIISKIKFNFKEIFISYLDRGTIDKLDLNGGFIENGII